MHRQNKEEAEQWLCCVWKLLYQGTLRLCELWESWSSGWKATGLEGAGEGGQRWGATLSLFMRLIFFTMGLSPSTQGASACLGFKGHPLNAHMRGERANFPSTQKVIIISHARLKRDTETLLMTTGRLVWIQRQVISFTCIMGLKAVVADTISPYLGARTYTTDCKSPRHSRSRVGSI